MVPLERLRKRRDFQTLTAQGRKFVTRSMVFLAMTQATPVLQHSMQTASSTPMATPARIGFTTTRKLGGAVIRNRIRRRLREAARQTFPRHARNGYDYVIIARAGACECPFEDLAREMSFALSHLHKGAGT